jgi:hypothetical protein
MADPRPAADLLTFNGVNGATGEYGLPPMTAEELSRFLRGEEKPENLAELRFRAAKQDGCHFGVKEGVDSKRLDQAGWGMVFARDVEPAVREALAPLLALRREQAGDLFKVFETVAGQGKAQFLARNGVGPGPAEPLKMPYYLLLVGSPEQIPYRFQSQLDVQYAVGRLHFERPEDYACYAAGVVAAEAGTLRLPRRLSFFAPENAGDAATRLSAGNLVAPLLAALRQARPEWQMDAFLQDAATKAGLGRLLGGSATPALLFTAGHGLEFPLGDPRQRAHQGALVCGDWPGPGGWQGALPQDFYFAGDDLTSDASLLGLVAFHFACYGAGTPRLDELARQAFKDHRADIAPEAFLAALPTALLSHPRGGALAVIGHVERAWGYSFQWGKAGAQTTVFESALTRLLDGHPVGSAMEYFNQRYAELSTVLADQLEEIDFGKEADPHELAGLWTANNDARGYVILGDPAVRLPVVAALGEGEADGTAITLELPFGGVPSLESLDAGAVAMSIPPAPPMSPMSMPPMPPAAPAPSAVPAAPEEPEDHPEDSGAHFSAWHPRALPVGESAQLLVYAHLLAARGAIAADAGQVLGQAAAGYREAQAPKAAAIAAGTEITLTPQAEGLDFAPPQARLTWSGAWQRADFTMRATGERAGHVVRGSIGCFVGPLLIADIPLTVVVPRPGEASAEEVAAAVESTRTYQAVFASYSHADTGIVEAMEKACQALGMDYLRDVMTLKSGQSWSDELLRMIEKADIFQLFWSAASCQSSYVEQEWRHALRLSNQKGAAFIRPIYWERPMAAVPSPLSHIHFAPVDLPGLPAKVSIPASVQAPAQFLEHPLTVSTYSGEALKARTSIAPAGDVETHLSADPVDAHLAELHARMVGEALRARLAYLEMMARK